LKLDKLRVLTGISSLATYFLGLARGVILGVPAFLRIGLVCLACPLGLLQVILASLTLTWELALALIFTLILLLVVGRVFCGWLCPTGVVVHVCCKPSGRRNTYAPFLLLAVLASSLLLRFPVFCVVCPVGLPFKMITFHLFGASPIVLTAVFIAWLVFAAVSARLGYSWCSYLCPLGYLAGLLSVKPLLRVRANTKCTRCGLCARLCPSAIDLPNMKYSERVRCTLCLKCVEKCPHNGAGLYLAGKEVYAPKLRK